MAKRISKEEIKEVWEIYNKGYKAKDVSVYLDMKLNRVEYILKCHKILSPWDKFEAWVERLANKWL